ncbi:MAG: hypothetical protein ACOZCO_06160 [Bacteroidota bacterium]
MKKQLVSILTLGVLLLASCGGESNNATTKVDSTAEDTVNNRIEEAQKIYEFIPSPKIMAELLMNANVPYQSKIMHDVQSVDKYTSSKQKALNLGIYGADLNYCNVYEKTHETMLYLRCTQSLSEDMGIENAISENTITRAEENADNRDSMSQIISDMFYELEDYLQENDKEDISALVIAGGWVEGLYLAVMSVDEKNPNQAIMNNIAEQKYSLEHLIHLLESYKEVPTVTDAHTEIVKLKPIYDGINITKEANTVTTAEDGVTTIGGNSKIEFSMDQLKQIKTTVTEIRESFIKI